MSEITNKQSATRILNTYDLESGEKLLIAYFPEEDVVTINGYPVSRAQGDAGMDGEALFLRHIDKKLFTVGIEILSRLNL